MSIVYNPTTLPKNDNISRFAYCVEVTDALFIQKGKMIAYYGNLKFETVGSGLLDILVKEAFNAPLYVHDYVAVTGRGMLVLGDQGNDIAGYDLGDANMTMRASNLLAVPPTLRVQESTLPGYLTVIGTGRLLASSNGPVHFLDLPCRVDEQAVLGWADCPSPSYRFDYSHVQNFITMAGAYTGFSLSGEERQLDFVGAGQVLVQSSEAGLQGRSVLRSITAQMGQLAKPELAQLAALAQARASGKQ